MANSCSFQLFVLGLFVSVTLLSPTGTNGQKMFIFGDSNYDPGNKQYLTTSSVPSTFWPYGLSIDYPSGKWSDGLIVPDFIAEFLEIPQIPGYFDQTANFSYGVNFAIADATILGEVKNTLNFSDQVAAFTKIKDDWTDTERASAIYLLYIGANDYLNYTATHSNPTSAEQQEFVNEVISEFKEQVTAIYTAGGRKFGLQNLAPLGCLPIVMQTYKSGNSCVELPNSLAEQHNSALLQTLEDLEQSLDGFQYAVYDYYNSTLRRIARSWNYRYFTATMSCCGVGSHNAYGCGYPNVHSNLCTYQRGYLFWDGRHNAEKTNEAIAHIMFSSDPSVIYPMNVRELYKFPAE